MQLQIDIKASGTLWFAASHKFDTQFLTPQKKPVMFITGIVILWFVKK